MWVGLYARQPLPLSQHDQSPLARAPPSMWVGLYARQPLPLSQNAPPSSLSTTAPPLPTIP